MPFHENCFLKCQSLFSGEKEKEKKNISKCLQLNVLPSMLDVKVNQGHCFTISLLSLLRVL